jgi:hypothetical protein
MTEYYLITRDLLEPDNWQVKEGCVVKDVGSNVFVSTTLLGAIKGRFQQMWEFEASLVKLYAEYNVPGVKKLNQKETAKNE